MIPGISHWELITVSKPARYIGGEVNQARAKPDPAVRFCLAYPDVYELGMSNVALKIMYELLNEMPEIYAERVFSPWTDMEALLRKKNLPLFSLETKTPLNQFDILGITLPYEMTFTNILNLLELGQIKLRRTDRVDGPIILGGGPSAANPLPMADFFDAFLIGDGEEAVVEVANLVLESKAKRLGRNEVLERLAHLDGFWVPAFPGSVKKRVFKGFPDSTPPLKPVVSNIQAIHDRSPLEIFRGCIRGCRFCNAGYYYRPKRERRVADLIAHGNEIIRNTGEESLGLLSLSTSDYTALPELICGLSGNRLFPEQSFAIPSMRMNDNTLKLLDSTPLLRKSGLTFAPEAGSQRMRDVIHKKITQDEILSVVSATSSSSYRNVKLYFMIGLPWETDQDIAEIAQLVKDISSICRRDRPPKNLSVSLSGFIPKPFTPFQWCGQEASSVLAARRRIVCDALTKLRLKVSWRDEFLCTLEGVLSRGDERVGRLIETAFRKGCKFDGWHECFRPDLWCQAFEESGINPEDYTSERDVSSSLPWDFVDIGTPTAFFKEEYFRAREAAGCNSGSE